MRTPPKKTSVELLEARIAPATFLVTNILDSGPGSLRQAILDANALTGPDSVNFNLPNLSVIKLATHLPAITDTIQINNNSFDFRFGIDGTGAKQANDANNASGLMILGTASSNSIISGLAIYGFDRAGIEISGSSNNTIKSCNLGLTPTAASVTSRMVEGVLVNGGSGNKIGTAIYGNVIGGNDYGIRITGGASGTVIEANAIGFAPGQGLNTTRPNETGVFVESATKTLIGSPIDLPSRGNIIAANASFGIKLGDKASSTTIIGNLIGLTASDSAAALGSQEWGIFVDGASSTTIGSAGTTSSPPVGNDIAGNRAGGIWMRISTNSGFQTIAGNTIGTEFGSYGGPYNRGHGIYVTQIGTISYSWGIGLTISGNEISSNKGPAIELRCNDAYLNARIVGNHIGSNDAGIIVDRTNYVTIGGRLSDANTISSSLGDGILIKYSTDVSVLGNSVLNGGGHGIHLISVGEVAIGRTLQPNTITNNSGDGILVERDFFRADMKRSISIYGNLVGKENSGNRGTGIHVSGMNTDVSILSNLVVGNGVAGIWINESTRTHVNENTVSGASTALRLSETVGIDISRNDFHSNAPIAVRFDPGTKGTIFGSLTSGNLITGVDTGLLVEGESNNIIGNRFVGSKTAIAIASGASNLISHNRFADVENGLFVDLGGDGVTPNDPLDADVGPNNLLNSPLLVSAALSGGQTLLRGEYRGAAQSDVRIEWYVNGELLAETSVRTDENGVARLALDLDQALEAGAKVSASATSGSNTSEFSAAVEAKVPAEVIAKGAAAGHKPRVQLRDAVTGEVLVDQLAFGKGFRGGVRVATADVDGDGITDLIATARTGNGTVKVFSGLDGHLISQFQAGPAKDPAIRSIAAGDLDGDGTIEVVVGRALTMGGRVLVHDALTGALESRHTPFGFNTPDSLNVSLSDTDGDNLPEIVIRAEVLGGMKRIALDPLNGHIERLAHLVRT